MRLVTLEQRLTEVVLGDIDANSVFDHKQSGTPLCIGSSPAIQLRLPQILQ